MVEESPQALYIWGSDYDVHYQLLEDSVTDGAAWGTNEDFEGGQDTGGYDDDTANDDGDYNDGGEDT
jgi:hypothetical protein